MVWSARAQRGPRTALGPGLHRDHRGVVGHQRSPVRYANVGRGGPAALPYVLRALANEEVVTEDEASSNPTIWNRCRQGSPAPRPHRPCLRRALRSSPQRSARSTAATDRSAELRRRPMRWPDRGSTALEPRTSSVSAIPRLPPCRTAVSLLAGLQKRRSHVLSAARVPGRLSRSFVRRALHLDSRASVPHPHHDTRGDPVGNYAGEEASSPVPFL